MQEMSFYSFRAGAGRRSLNCEQTLTVEMCSMGSESLRPVNRNVGKSTGTTHGLNLCWASRAGHTSHTPHILHCKGSLKCIAYQAYSLP